MVSCGAVPEKPDTGENLSGVLAEIITALLEVGTPALLISTHEPESLLKYCHVPWLDALAGLAVMAIPLRLQFPEFEMTPESSPDTVIPLSDGTVGPLIT